MLSWLRTVLFVEIKHVIGVLGLSFFICLALEVALHLSSVIVVMTDNVRELFNGPFVQIQVDSGKYFIDQF